MNDPFAHDWDGQTVLHPVALIAVLLLGGTMVLVKRPYATIPMMLMACFVSPAQRLVVATLDFNLLRLMVLFGTLRIVMHSEWRAMRWRTLDTCIVAWTIVGLMASIVLMGSLNGFVNRLGTSFDAIGTYFLFRILIRTVDDVVALTRACVVIAFPVALAFLVENRTSRNVFAFLGGVPEMTMVRNGRLRCQGAFAHPILAGCFWACLLPLVAAQWWRGRTGKTFAIAGGIAFGAIIVLSASSTPVMGVLFTALGALMFLMRRQMRTFRWGLLITAIVLHLVMNKPVWHLLARVDLVDGSSGWHRYALIDGAVNHADEWIFCGTAVGTDHWGWGLFDVTNHYLVQGLQGGIIQLALFIAIISFAYRGVGRMWRAAEKSPANVALAWAVGVSLFVHTSNFIAVTYFGQINMVWYLSLALVGSLEPVRSRRALAPKQQRTAQAPRRRQVVSRVVIPPARPAAAVRITS